MNIKPLLPRFCLAILASVLGIPCFFVCCFGSFIYEGGECFIGWTMGSVNLGGVLALLSALAASIMEAMVPKAAQILRLRRLCHSIVIALCASLIWFCATNSIEVFDAISGFTYFVFHPSIWLASVGLTVSVGSWPLRPPCTSRDGPFSR